MSDTPKHSVSVAGVTFDRDGYVLLVKRRDNGQWQAPGGILELNESFEDGVAREVLEETGVEVEVQHLTGVYKNMARGVVALVYRCRPITNSPQPTEEAIESKWVSLDDALRRVAPAFAIRIQDAATYSKLGASSRAHDGEQLF